MIVLGIADSITSGTAIVVDGQVTAALGAEETARSQFIREKDNPSYSRILKEYQAITGLSSLINTSFNMHEEPIAYPPADAITPFEQSRLDALALGKYLVQKRGDNG